MAIVLISHDTNSDDEDDRRLKQLAGWKADTILRDHLRHNWLGTTEQLLKATNENNNNNNSIDQDFINTIWSVNVSMKWENKIYGYVGAL